jgi:ribosomal protein S18 acetylase RimI-like enzyme
MHTEVSNQATGSIRKAGLDDLDDLVRIENACFEIDRFSRRSFRYLLSRAHAETYLYVEGGITVGYTMILFNTGTSLSRLYSYAVDPAYRNRGIGRLLLEMAERAARDRDCAYMRLEVRKDNDQSIRLIKQSGYRQIGIVPDYYEDHMDAIRYEKMLQPVLKPELMRIPYYEQTLDFTCGPSALMMGMKALDPSIQMDRKLELRIWRESTTIYMTSGHGGCGPYGMALSAYHRGFDVELYLNETGAMFIDSVRSEEKKEVMRLVQEDFVEELRDLPVRIHNGALSAEEMKERFNEGGIPIVLISSYRIYHEKFPHWVVVTGFDEHYVYAHDPFVEYEIGKTPTDCINMPILQKDFQHMARYGKAGQKAAIVLKKKAGKK